jgi:hypothetical protein
VFYFHFRFDKLKKQELHVSVETIHLLYIVLSITPLLSHTEYSTYRARSKKLRAIDLMFEDIRLQCE